jgi:hypothetical protein
MTSSFKSSLLLISFFLLLACNEKPAPDNGEEKMAAPAPLTPTVDSRLYLLYSTIDATGNDLDNLTKSAKGDKLVFQFYYQSGGQLTLAAYAGKAGHSDFDITQSPIMNIVNIADPTVVYQDISGKDIYLGDQEIGKKHPNALKKLTNLLNSTTRKKYIIFIPKISPADGFPQRKLITYLLVNMSDLPTTKYVYDSLINLPIPTTDTAFLTGSTIPTNPSPPRGGN